MEIKISTATYTYTYNGHRCSEIPIFLSALEEKSAARGLDRFYEAESRRNGE